MRHLFLLLIFVSSVAIAGEGHHWAKLDSQSKLWVAAMYGAGEGLGCVNGVRHATSELFADDGTQVAQYMRLSSICDLNYANDANVVGEIINSIDSAYAIAGAPDIPLGIVLMLAFDNHKKGVKEIPKSVIKQWIESVSNR